MFYKNIISIIITILMFINIFQTTGFSQEIKSTKTMDELVVWYKDVNRKSNVFTLTGDVNIETNLSLLKENRNDDVALKIDTGMYSINFSPVSPRSNFTIEDENLTITGNGNDIINIKNGIFNFNSGRLLGTGDNAVIINSNGNVCINGGLIEVSGANSIAVKSNKIIYFDGGTIYVKGQNSVGTFATGFIYLIKGEISAEGSNSTALSISAATEVSTPSSKYTPQAMKIIAKGENSIAVKIIESNNKVSLRNVDILADDKNSIAIFSDSSIVASYSKIIGNTLFSENSFIDTYLCELSDNTYEKKQECIVKYDEEIISVDGQLPTIEKFTIFDLNKKQHGGFVADIIWNDNIGTLDMLVKTDAPFTKKAYVYQSTNTENCDLDNLLKWYNDSEHAENEVFTLTGDIFVNKECELVGDTPLVIDTDDYTIFVRDKLTVNNKNLKITGKGNDLGVICIDTLDSAPEIVMPNGGEITATEGDAVFSMKNLAFGGVTTVSSIRLLGGGVRYVSSADITETVSAFEDVLFVNCIIRGDVISKNWAYALCDVPEGNEDRDVGIDYYSFEFTENGSIVSFENEFDIELLPDSYNISVKVSSPYTTIANIKVPVIWNQEDINNIDVKTVGVYKVNGKLQGFDEEQPVINIDIINKDRLTILGDGVPEYRFKDVAIYFKLPDGVPLVEGETFFEVQYSTGSIEEGANTGTIAPIIDGQTGYSVSDLEYPIREYSTIILDSKKFEYEFLKNNNYCFRVKTKYDGKDYFSDELWFPEQNEDGDLGDGTDLPSTPEDSLNEGGRGGGNRYSSDTKNQKNVSIAQTQNLLASGKQKNTFVIDGITVILTPEVLKELGKDDFTIYAQKNNSTDFTVYFKKEDKIIRHIDNRITIHVPYNDVTDAIYKVDGNIVRNSYVDEDIYVIKTSSLGDFTIHDVNSVQFNDTYGHWANDTIKYARSRELISGDGDGRFRPDDAIKESEFIKILDGILLDNNVVFDASKNNVISRMDVAVLLYDAYGNENVYDTPLFTDINGLEQRYVSAVGFVNESGLMKGRKNGQFAPHISLTRAEAIQIIRNVVQADI